MTTTIIKTTTKILAPLILIFGSYIILHGHLTPGGGFQG
ncbi:MnhB domain-containing protein, partial [Thermococcus sp. ES12]